MFGPVLRTELDNLWLLKAGRAGADYAAKVNTFPWDRMHQRSPYIFRELAQGFARRYRHVLIDSRTGLTDTSGICTTLLPEKLVVVFTPNRQSLSGIEQLVRHATEYRRKSDDRRPLLVYPLPSRIELDLDQLRTLWRRGNKEGIKGYQPLFEDVFASAYGISDCRLEEYFEAVLIKQSKDYAYGEEVAARREQSVSADRHSLLGNYQAFLEWLSNSFAPWEGLQQARATGNSTLCAAQSRSCCRVVWPTRR